MFAPEKAIPIGTGLTVPRIAEALDGAGVTGATLREFGNCRHLQRARSLPRQPHACGRDAGDFRADAAAQTQALNQPYREQERRSL
jgi:hypothetical protein